MYLFRSYGLGHAARGAITVGAAVLMAVTLTSCAERVRTTRADYERRVEAASDLDPQTVLAGRPAEAVLNEALSQSGCEWTEKALFGTSDHRLTLEAYRYDTDSRRLTLNLSLTSEQGFGRLHRYLSTVTVDLSAVTARAAPPDPFGTMSCWAVHLSCPGADCIRRERRFQVVKNGEVVEEEGESPSRSSYFQSLNFPWEKDAIDAFAALQTLAE